MSGVGRYWRLALDLMPRPDLAVHPTLGKPNVLRMDDFPANDTASVMQAARRASSLLGLPDPILAEGLIDGASRELSASDGAGWRLYLRGRWMGASNFSKLLILIGVVCLVW